MKRVVWIDVAKALAIWLVVMGHVCQWRFPEAGKWLADIIYTFHMPLFLFLSGLFAKKAIEAADEDHVVGYMMKKSRQLLLPFMVWMLLWCGIKQDSPMLFLEGGFIYWYLLTLFEFLMLFCCLRLLSNMFKIKDKLFPLVLLLSAFMLYCIPASSHLGIFLRIYYSSYFYLFFVLGFLFDRYVLMNKQIAPPDCFQQVRAKLFCSWFL